MPYEPCLTPEQLRWLTEGAEITASAHLRALEFLRWEERLPTLLSVVSGAVDVIGFLTLKVFTAHVTGNLVLIGAELVREGPPRLDQDLAIPTFILAVAVVWLIARTSQRRGPALARLLVLSQLVLLSCVQIVSFICRPSVNPQGSMVVVAAMLAVSAMACQYALLRLVIPAAPSTAGITGNLTAGILAFLDTMSREPLTQDSGQRLRKTFSALLGFFLGCMVGAAAVLILGDWAWSIPVVLSLMAMLLVPSRDDAGCKTFVV